MIQLLLAKGLLELQQAIYLKRYNKNVLVIKDLGALEKTTKIENYYGFPTGIDGKELIQNGITRQNIWELMFMMKKLFKSIIH